MCSMKKEKPYISQETLRRITEAWVSSELDGELREDIRVWLYELFSRSAKDYDAFIEIFRDLCQKQENVTEESLRNLKTIQRELGLSESDIKLTDGQAEIPQLRQPDKARKSGFLFRRTALRVAAVLLPAMLVVGTLMLTKKTEEGILTNAQGIETTVGDDPDIDKNIIRGKRITITENSNTTLPDNSTVRVGSGSRLYHSEEFAGQRKVELHGEAHFNVSPAADETDCFTVHTGHFEISVLGTEFDVRCPAGEDYSTIDLLHGSIRVATNSKEYLLEPGEHLLFCHSTGAVEITPLPIAGRRYDNMPGLIFDGESLFEIFDKIQKNYRVNIEVKNIVDMSDMRADLRKAGSMEEIMRILATVTGHFSYEIASDKIIVTPPTTDR